MIHKYFKHCSGRAQMGLGEVELAVKSFQRAVHLNPEDEELRREDLEWAVGLLRHSEQMKQSLESTDNSVHDDNTTADTTDKDKKNSTMIKCRT